MKKSFLFSFIILLMVSNLAFARKKIKSVTMKITLIEGRANNCLLKRAKDKQWRVARIKDRLHEGDQIKTLNNVRVELVSSGGHVIRLNQRSRFEVKKTRKKKKTLKTRIKLWLGKSWFKIKKMTKGRRRFETETPSAVAGVYGTTYRVDVNDDKSTSVKVYSGEVRVGSIPHEVPGPTELKGVEPHEVPGPTELKDAGPREVSKKEWEMIVTSEQQITVSFDNLKINKRKFDLAEDEKEEWVQWNKKRDAALGWE